MNLRMYLKAAESKIERQSKAKSVISFILFHEIGHVLHNHAERRIDYLKKLSQPKYVILNILTLGIFKRAALDLQSRKHEKEADAFAFKASKMNTEGSICLRRSRNSSLKAP